MFAQQELRYDEPSMRSMLEQLQSQQEIIAALCREHNVRELSVFGSVATGEFDPQRSDVDFLVKFDGVPIERYARNYFDLLRKLEKLVSRNVDLVSDKGIRKPRFRAIVERQRISLYAA